MKATINDVSRLAKVSISTVSHVLNGTRSVNEDTRQRVLRAIEETGYIPNLMAKGLKQAQTQTIGLLVTDIKNEFFTDVVHIIDTEARKDGYQVFVSSSDEDPQKEHEIIRAFCERRVDGIIWSPTRDSDKFSLEYLRRMQVPVVMIDRSIGGDFDFVGVENYESTKLLVRYVVGLGYRKIGFLAGFGGISTTEERIRGYNDVICECRLEQNDSWLIAGDYRKNMLTEAILRAMTSGNSPTAWIAANNRMVYSAMRAFTRLGLRVPEDVALASFGDFEWAEYLEPRLTALAQPCYQIGIEALRLLKERIGNRQAPVQRISLAPLLVKRQSCGEAVKGTR